jgi:hypothetical protein
MSGSHALVTAKFNAPDNEVQSAFRRRNHVSDTYRGPVYVVEDIYVPCALCRAPVDPVSRIPVGRLHFHPRCLRCSLCDKPAKDQAFAERNGQPVCAECDHRGFRPAKQLHSSHFSSESGWADHAQHTPFHASRTPASAMTQSRLRLEARQLALLQGDSNIRLMSHRHGDDPSQHVAYINNPKGIAQRQASRQGGARPAITSVKQTTETPAKQLLPSLAAAAGSASLSRARRVSTSRP